MSRHPDSKEGSEGCTIASTINSFWNLPGCKQVTQTNTLPALPQRLQLHPIPHHLGQYEKDACFLVDLTKQKPVDCFIFRSPCLKDEGELHLLSQWSDLGEGSGIDASYISICTRLARSFSIPPLP